MNRQEKSDLIVYPLGGIGAGMLGLSGHGKLTEVSIFHHRDKGNAPYSFAALHIYGRNLTKVLESSPSPRMITSMPEAANGIWTVNDGFPHCQNSTFHDRFPFGVIDLQDDELPLKVRIVGWSPFIPGDADNSSLPVAGIEYRISNPSAETVSAMFSYHLTNFLPQCWNAAPGTISQHVGRSADGLCFESRCTAKGRRREAFLHVGIHDPEVKVDPQWFRSNWFDHNRMTWHWVSRGVAFDREAFPVTDSHPSRGGSLSLPFTLRPGETKQIALEFSWYVPESELRTARHGAYYKPWYCTRYPDIRSVAEAWRGAYSRLREESRKFSDSFYRTDTDRTVVSAIGANLCILKSPTILRESSGRIWCWEGCMDSGGSCYGSCTHVWNYAQAMAHLFPSLERSLRETEFFNMQFPDGFQNFRHALPLRKHPPRSEYIASDGQLGGIMKFYRDWKISGDRKFLRRFWPKVRQSLDYCINTLDPDHCGVLIEPHHSTYDTEFWGPESMCSSYYLGALKAAALLAEEMNEDPEIYRSLYRKGREYVERELFNGEYFEQKVIWKGLRAGSPLHFLSNAGLRWYPPEAMEILNREGPKYQVGSGCLADGVVGCWMAEVCGLGEILDPAKVKSHLLSVYRYNFIDDFAHFVNPQRKSYVSPGEKGVVVCSWPRGGKPTIPLMYAEEVFTGVEYQLAAHLISFGCIDEGLEIVRAVRQRYDGASRNPYNEFECGSWYGRVLSCYSLLQTLSGFRYDAVERTLYVKVVLSRPYRSFLAWGGGFALVEYANGKATWKDVSGHIAIDRIVYEKKQ